MTAKQIKIMLLERDLTIAGLAREFGCMRQQLQFCIYRHRPYPELQKQLASRLGYTVEELFGPDKPKKSSVICLEGMMGSESSEPIIRTHHRGK